MPTANCALRCRCTPCLQVATTLGLGTWQLMRYSWKVDVLKQRAQQLQEPPLDLSSGAGDDTCVARWRRARAVRRAPIGDDACRTRWPSV